MADHFAGPRRRDEDVLSTGSRRETFGRSAGPFLGAIRDKVLARTGKSQLIVVIQEAGLDGFWIHRSLVKEGIESQVVDARLLDRSFAAPSTCQDGQDRWRSLAAGAAGLQAGRAAGVCDGAGSHASRTRIAAGFVASARR